MLCTLWAFVLFLPDALRRSWALVSMLTGWVWLHRNCHSINRSHTAVNASGGPSVLPLGGSDEARLRVWRSRSTSSVSRKWRQPLLIPMVEYIPATYPHPHPKGCNARLRLQTPSPPPALNSSRTAALTYVHVSIYIYVYIHLSLSLSLSLYICMYTYIYIYR